MSKELKIGMVVLALLAVAGLVYYAYGQGAAAGAVVATLAAAEVYRRRGEQEVRLEVAVEDASEAVDRLDKIEADADEVHGNNTSEVANMSGQEQADLINKLTER